MGEPKYHQSFKMRDFLMVFITKATTSNMCLSNPSIPPPDGGGKWWRTSVSMPTYIWYILYNFYNGGMSERHEKPSELQNGRLFDGVYTDA